MRNKIDGRVNVIEGSAGNSSNNASRPLTLINLETVASTGRSASNAKSDNKVGDASDNLVGGARETHR